MEDNFNDFLKKGRHPHFFVANWKMTIFFFKYWRGPQFFCKNERHSHGISAHYINASYQIFKNIQDPIEQETRKVRQSVQKKEVELDSPTSKGKSQTNKDCDQNKVTNTKLSYECEYCDKRFSVSFTTINIFYL